MALGSGCLELSPLASAGQPTLLLVSMEYIVAHLDSVPNQAVLTSPLTAAYSQQPHLYINKPCSKAAGETTALIEILTLQRRPEPPAQSMRLSG